MKARLQGVKLAAGGYALMYQAPSGQDQLLVGAREIRITNEAVREDPPNSSGARSTMRRKDKEIHDRNLIEYIIAKARVCRLGLCKDNMPYIVPVAFGYDGAFMFFHSADEGMKLDHLACNKRICFELEHEVRVIPNATKACKWSFSYYSVIGFGTVAEIVDHQRKVYALNQIMRHYSNGEWDYDEHAMEKVRLWCITIEQVTGKQSQDKIANG